MRVQQTGGVQTFPIEAHAVAVHHLRLQTFDSNRGPNGGTVHVHGHRYIFHNRAHGTQTVSGLTHLVVHIGFAVCAVKTFEQHTDAQTGNAAAQGCGVAVYTRAVLARVQTVSARNHFEQQSVVRHIGCHGSCMVDGGFNRHDAGVWHQAMRGFHAVNAAP